ncbi:MAG TPA: hypothetical protein VFG68_17095 [Fimbriiglobus sp.]|nr:hypothetical protein [Fimbriiglobus sp.]
MPIRFRCPTCNRQLSTARRKAGTQVVCPRCEDEITVPDADLADPGTAEVSQPVEAVQSGTTMPPRVNGHPATTRPVVVAPKPGDSGPLFEQEDFERFLEPTVRTAGEEAAKTSPLLPMALTPEDGVTISRGAVASLAVLMVVLLAMAFATGYLVGTQ